MKHSERANAFAASLIGHVSVVTFYVLYYRRSVYDFIGYDKQAEIYSVHAQSLISVGLWSILAILLTALLVKKELEIIAWSAVFTGISLGIAASYTLYITDDPEGSPGILPLAVLGAIYCMIVSGGVRYLLTTVQKKLVHDQDSSDVN